MLWRVPNEGNLYPGIRWAHGSKVRVRERERSEGKEGVSGEGRELRYIGMGLLTVGQREEGFTHCCNTTPAHT